jgi:hypothetical protein
VVSGARRIPVPQTPAAAREEAEATPTPAVAAEMRAVIPTPVGAAEMPAAIRTPAVAVEMRVVMDAEATEAAATPGAADLRTAISRVGGGEGTPARIRQTAVAGAEIQGTSTALETTVR